MAKQVINLKGLTLGQLVSFFDKGRFATVVFTKKSDGSERVLNGKTKVLKALRGGQPAYDAKAYGQLRVCDVNIYKEKVRKTEYRSVTVKNVKEIRANGKIYKIENVVPQENWVQNPIRRGENLVVSLSGRDYEYRNVPKNLVTGLQEAKSRGKFFNDNIKGRFDYVRLS